MNRDIKFRIWFPHLKAFGNPLEVVIGFDGKVYGFTRPTINDSRLLVEISQLKELRDCVVLQFTGWKDSNGVEICEGDIILDEWAQDDPFSNTPDVPRYEHKIFEVKYIEGCFNLKKDPIKHRCSYNFKRKVVGNIFENKALLPIPEQIKETLNDEEFSTSEMIDLLLNKV